MSMDVEIEGDFSNIDEKDKKNAIAFVALMNNLTPEMERFVAEGREGIVYLLALKMTEKHGELEGCCIASAHIHERDLQLYPPSEKTIEAFKALHEHMKEAEFVHDEATMPQKGSA